MSKKPFFPALAIVVLLSMLVFSMSAVSLAQDATATPEPLPSPTPAIASMGSGDLQLSFWNGLTGSDGVTLNEMLTQFVVDHPEISVTTEIVDWNTLYTKLQAAFVAGTPPDVILPHPRPLVRRQRPHRGRSGFGLRRVRLSGAIDPAARHRQHATGGAHPDGLCQGFG